jgi:hypothetical protein
MTLSRIPYIVHLLIDNDWVVWSWHYNEDTALINVDVHTRSKGCSGRVIYNGKIIYEVVK